MFNSFNTLIGLGLTICAFTMQAKIDNVCGSKPLRNSILGILVIGMTMFWLGGVSLYSGAEVLTKNLFAGFVGALGATLVGLGSVIVQKSKQECKDDVVCKQTIATGNNSNSDTPCDGAKLWGGIVVAAGCLMIVGAGAHAMMATGVDQMALNRLEDLKLMGRKELIDAKVAAKKTNQKVKAKQAEEDIQAFQKMKAQDIAAKGVRPTNAQLLGGRGNLKKSSNA
jgi:hypothetical protein